MTRRPDFSVSRRTVLAGLGTVGVAAAGVGLGATALFTDTERFVGNSLRAGTFDRLVDWQQTYDGPNGHEYVNAYPDADVDGTSAGSDAALPTALELAKRELEADYDATAITVHYEVDVDVGNEIQSDSLAFEVGVEAEQCRHNPTPFAPEPSA